MTPRSILIVTNPKSYRVAKRGTWAELATALSPDIRSLTFESAPALTTAMGQMAEDGITTIFIEGGDGTVLAVLSAALAHAERFTCLPQFAILPGGSTNLAFKALGFRATGRRKFQSRLAALLEGAEVQRSEQRGLVIDANAFPVPQVGFVLSTGSLARAMRHVQDAFHGDGHRGSLAVALALVRFLAFPSAYLDETGQPVVRASFLSLQGEGLSREGPHGLGLLSTLPRLSLALNPFWAEGQGAISLTLADWPMPGLRRALLRILFFKNRDRLAALGFTSHRIHQVDVASDAALMLDGELFHLGPDETARISVTEPLRFLR